MTRASLQAGFTLIETAIVGVIAGVMLLTVALLTSSTNDAYKTVQEDTDANFSLRQALTRIGDDLRQSDSAFIVLTLGTNYDSIDVQMPVSYLNSTVTWGANGTAGWHVKILVDTNYGWLVRRVTDANGIQKVVDQVLASNVDTLNGGVKGFSVTGANGLYTISLRVVAQRGVTVWRRTETTSVQTRN